MPARRLLPSFACLLACSLVYTHSLATLPPFLPHPTCRCMCATRSPPRHSRPFHTLPAAVARHCRNSLAPSSFLPRSLTRSLVHPHSLATLPPSPAHPPGRGRAAKPCARPAARPTRREPGPPRARPGPLRRRSPGPPRVRPAARPACRAPGPPRARPGPPRRRSACPPRARPTAPPRARPAARPARRAPGPSLTRLLA
jgi:hypothetical protein